MDTDIENYRVKINKLENDKKQLENRLQLANIDLQKKTEALASSERGQSDLQIQHTEFERKISNLERRLRDSNQESDEYRQRLADSERNLEEQRASEQIVQRKYDALLQENNDLKKKSQSLQASEREVELSKT